MVVVGGCGCVCGGAVASARAIRPMGAARDFRVFYGESALGALVFVNSGNAPVHFRKTPTVGFEHRPSGSEVLKSSAEVYPPCRLPGCWFA